MKALVFVLGAAILYQPIEAQNLVPNPSFEEYIICPYFNPNNIKNTLYWSTPTYSTDFFHPCATLDRFSVPQNVRGNQYSNTGNSYADIIVFHHPDYTGGNPFPDAKEYLSNMLTSSMEEDSYYMVSMFLSLGDDSDYGCDCIQVWLTDDEVEVAMPENSPLIDGPPQLVEVTDGHGCTATDGVSIIMKNARRVYIPNAFSPNGDGINDVFSVYGGPEVAGISTLKIFDRWGEMVFWEEGLLPDGSTGWDGSFNNRGLDNGVFACSVSVVFIDGSVQFFQQGFTLVK